MTEDLQTLDYFERKSKGFFRKQKVRIKHKLGWLGVPEIIPCRGFASYAAGQAFIAGALTEDKGLEKLDGKNTLGENILAMLKRYSGDQIPSARVKVELSNATKELVTEENGIFKTKLPVNFVRKKEKTRWLHYHAELMDKTGVGSEKYSAQGEILVPGSDARFAVISDIDDTIMVSHSTQTLSKLRLILTHNSRTRKPFPGVEAFYCALHLGGNGNDANPFFYISSSEWNLYDLIDDFCTFNKFPKGGLFAPRNTSGHFKFVETRWRKPRT
ncbi:DUF2183 domain-containing protein [Maribellus comscasis]|uniref:DUF2183 domain-containing protein n=1 Tax=Maribellus comscasis TaxID=2681766 RepID=A0A6I6K1Y7_9BACT|nr:phosphatase domain-containing protein [Maribellus comscasis]QGY47669.1 DUF2183 domain-containing protein [Maribellus comscasis]